MEAELGGHDGFMTLFGCHYCNMFANPRMSVLFNSSQKDTNVCALDHGKRVANLLLDFNYDTSYLRAAGRGNVFARLNQAHQTAKKCPMRPEIKKFGIKQSKALPFTINQRDSWVGSVMDSAEQCGCSEEFQKMLGVHLALAVSAYGPFVNEDNGELDYM